MCLESREGMYDVRLTDMFRRWNLGRLGGSVVEHLPLVQGMIPGYHDRVPHLAPYKEPASPSAYVSASLCEYLMNK